MFSLLSRYLERFFNMFSKNKELFWIRGLYKPIISHFTDCMFISIYIASVPLSKSKFNCLYAIFSFTYIQRPPPKQFLSCLHILSENNFNPPFSLSFKTNIGRTFLKLLKQHFPKSNRLHKIFNKNTLKLRYSCTSNMSSIISSHNKRLLRLRITGYGCSCRTTENCP